MVAEIFGVHKLAPIGYGEVGRLNVVGFDMYETDLHVGPQSLPLDVGIWCIVDLVSWI